MEAGMIRAIPIFQPFSMIDQEQLTLRRYAAYIYSPTMLSAHEHKLVMVQLMKRS